MAGLTWLHLSDWHQKGENFDRKIVRDALIKDIEERSRIHKDLEKIDFIVFSGDVAFHGKEEEYEAANEYFFKPVLNATGLDKSHFFIVPGNHDVDHDAFKFLPDKILHPLTSNDDINEWLCEDKGRKLIMEPFEAYFQFVKPYSEGNLSAYGAYQEFIVDNRKVSLIGINSALMCGRHRNKDGKIDDYGKLILGEPQIYDALNKNANADLRIVVMHHPFDWLTENDRSRVEDHLRKHAHFILCGHRHSSQVRIERSTAGECVIIPAGAAYDRRIASDPRYTNAYNFVRLDYEKNKGAVYLRHWSDEGGAWVTHIRETHPEGLFEFTLLKNLNPIKDGISHSRSNSCENFRKKEEKPSNPTEIYDLNNPVFNVPFRAKGEGMVGHEETLEKVNRQLTVGKQTAIGHTAAFQGIGGLGKTQLAVEFAHHYRNRYPNGVIWINADIEINTQLINIAKQGRWISSESKHKDVLDAAKRRLKNWSKCLVIFDNVENLEDIEPFFPETHAAPHLLITSHAPQKGFHPIEIALLDEELSLTLLLKESCRNFTCLSEMEKKAATKIANSLGGLPLAIEIAGAYLEHVPECTFENYLAILETNLKDAMNSDLMYSFTRHEEKNLFLTLQVSKSVLKRAPILEEILNLLTWSSNSFMGIPLMAAVLNVEESELFHPLALGTSLRLLQKISGEDRYDIHSLVRRVRQEQFPIIDRKEWIIEICTRMEAWFKGLEGKFECLPDFEAEIDHLKMWIYHIKPYSFEIAARLTRLLAHPSELWGKYYDARDIYSSALSLLEKSSEVDLSLKAVILSELAAMYGALGEFSKSLKYHKKAFYIRQEIFGEYHPDTALSLNNIGGSYDDLGYHKEALECKIKSLGIYLIFYGALHPVTSAIMSNVGYSCDILGRHREALKYKKRALEIQLKLFGEVDPNTATILNNIGHNYDALGNHQEALNYKKHALEITLKLFGNQHPLSAKLRNNIGSTYSKMGSQSEALLYLEQAFQIQVRVFGELHPETVLTKGNIIAVLIELRRFQEASELLDKYLEMLPEDHRYYNYFHSLKKSLHKKKIKCKRVIPSKKRKQKKK